MYSDCSQETWVCERPNSHLRARRGPALSLAPPQPGGLKVLGSPRELSLTPVLGLEGAGTACPLCSRGPPPPCQQHGYQRPTGQDSRAPAQPSAPSLIHQTRTFCTGHPGSLPARGATRACLPDEMRGLWAGAGPGGWSPQQPPCWVTPGRLPWEEPSLHSFSGARPAGLQDGTQFCPCHSAPPGTPHVCRAVQVGGTGWFPTPVPPEPGLEPPPPCALGVRSPRLVKVEKAATGRSSHWGCRTGDVVHPQEHGVCGPPQRRSADQVPSNGTEPPPQLCSPCPAPCHVLPACWLCSGAGLHQEGLTRARPALHPVSGSHPALLSCGRSPCRVWRLSGGWDGAPRALPF